MGVETATVIIVIPLVKMASSQGGVGAVTALPNHHLSNGPHWNPGINQHQLHTARSLDRALEDAVCSGTLNLSGRKLRDYPGLCYDLTDTTQAGGFPKCWLLLRPAGFSWLNK